MARYFLTFSYDGTAYHGWQAQPNAVTVQQQLERALGLLLRRTYHYYVYTGKRPFLRQYACRLFAEPDYERMNRAAALLLQTSDFTSFSKLHTDTKTNLCRVSEALWTPQPDGTWRFSITADRFLRNMVRAVVGTLLWVGQGRMSEADFQRVIDSRNRCAAGDSVAANALFLVDIAYPSHIFLAD